MEARDLYSDNYKTLLKEIKDINGNTSHVHGLEDHFNVITTQSSLQIQCNLYQNLNEFFTEIEKHILKLIGYG